MCTLTYLPLPDAGYYLTSNRDESPLRARARQPETRSIGRREVLFPVDGKAGGTWIGAANDRRTVCLLNGAFQPHKMGGRYRLSRGIMVLESFSFPNVDAFAREYDFEGIEPFTYVDLLARDGEIDISELRWDGQDLHRKRYDAGQAQIWSSAQLYLPEVIERRENWFRKWLGENDSYALEDIQRFHHFGGEGDVYNDIRMNRFGMVQTVSTTAIENRKDQIKMHYEDLLSDSTVSKTLHVQA
jgi:hypothetical protein